MAEGKTNMFGKTYNTIGSTDSNFIIKTKGDLKVQWGNKFIDVIKNGKIASSGGSFIKLVQSEEEVSGTGIFVVQSEEDSQVWISIDDTKINVTDVDTSMYVSYLLEDTPKDSDKKQQALRNIGFYYQTLDDANNAGLKSGIIFVEDQNGLYLVQNGQLVEYRATQSITSGNTSNENVSSEPLYIKGQSLWVGTDQYISCEDSYNKIHKRLMLEDGLQSRDATSTQGYRLYMENGNSVLEIDYLRVRYPEIQEDPDWEQYPLFTKKDNIISSSILSEDEQYIEATLVNYNTYEPDEYIYVLLDLNISTVYENNQYHITLSRYSQKDTEFIVKYIGEDDNEYTNTVTINAGDLKGSVYVPQGIIPKIIYDNTKELKEYKIVSVNKQIISLEIPEEEMQEFINSAHYIYLSRSPFLHIDKNTMYNLDRSKMVIDEETGEEKPDDYPHSIFGEVKEEELEILQEPVEEERQLEEFVKPDVGLYNDKLLALNPTLYNTTFKTVRKDPETEHPYYPKYFEEIKLPEEKKLLDKKFNYIVPDMEWIKRMLDFFFPVGSIIMFNGQSEIPPGWEVCDGNNGTPNLIGRFIKADTGIGESNPDGVDDQNTLQLQEKHLPQHSHPHQPHVHGMTQLSGYTDGSGDLSMSFNWSDYLWGLSSSSMSVVTSVSGEGVDSSGGSAINSVSANTQGGSTSGGNHTHNVYINGGQILEATSYEDSKQWTNERIKIEPKAYNLIFIMKTQPFVDYVNND